MAELEWAEFSGAHGEPVFEARSYRLGPDSGEIYRIRMVVRGGESRWEVSGSSPGLGMGSVGPFASPDLAVAACRAAEEEIET